jgi:hypothetical protein
MRSSRLFVSLVLAAILVSARTASAQGWGTIKGRIELDGELPAIKPLVVLKNRAQCLAKGPLFPEQWVVDPKTRGVKWVVVWIAPDVGGKAAHKAPLKIHPALIAVPKAPVVMDQPCCQFVPHIAVIRQGQDFEGRNSSPIAHNMSIIGKNFQNAGQILPPKGGLMKIPAARWEPYYLPSTVNCGIHPWMSAKIFVFDHPYFAVTNDRGEFEIKNVPAGKHRLLIWHEGMGWVVKDPAGKGKDGVAINVVAGKTVEVNQYKVKP